MEPPAPDSDAGIISVGREEEATIHQNEAKYKE
jgi:hypothetical protein